MNINLRIERLVLNDVGIQPHQKNELKEAVASALNQQLVSQGIGSTMRSETSRSSINGGSISIETSQSTESLGQQIGLAVYRGIGK